MDFNALAGLGVTPFNGYGDLQAKPEPKKKNGLMNALSTMFEYGAPEAFERGQQKKHQRQLTNALQSRDFGGAADAAFASGNINGGLDLLDYQGGMQTQQAEAAQAEKMQKLQGMAAFTQNMRQIPEAQRGQWAMDNWQMLEPIVGKDFMTFWQESGGDVSDASLDEDLLAIQTALGQGPAAPEYGFQNVDGQLYRTDKASGGVEAMTERQPDTISSYQQAQLDLKRERLDFDKSKPRTPLVSINNPFGAGEKSLADIPVGQPIPTKMLGGVTPDEGKMFVRANTPMGFEQVLIPGSEAERLSNAKSEAGEGREYGLGTLVRSYATLNENKAITSQNNSAGQNLGALYSGTGLGKFQDAIGGDIGNTENTTARNTIQGLSMKALMDMISMSDVSAKAMDSDAEMKAWLSAIKDDNYEAAMSKLHALDVSFGGGDLMRKMFGEGVIDQPTYQFVTNRAQTDPQTVAMMKKMDRYSGLDQSVGSDNLTPEEQDELSRLRAELGVE